MAFMEKASRVFKEEFEHWSTSALAGKDVDAPQAIRSYKLPQIGGNFYIWAHFDEALVSVKDIMWGKSQFRAPLKPAIPEFLIRAFPAEATIAQQNYLVDDVVAERHLPIASRYCPSP